MVSYEVVGELWHCIEKRLMGKRLRERYYDCVFAIYNRLVYRRLAKYYDLFGSLSTFKKAQVRVVEGLSSGSILDVACGTGSVLAMASEKGLACYGIDMSPGMMAQAKSKVPGAELKVGSFEDIAYPDDSFDYVVCTNSIGCVKVTPRNVISEMVRVCKKGGEIRIADYAEPPKRTFKARLLIMFFKALGDTPYDYVSIFRDIGYKPEVEILGLYGTYQFLRVNKKRCTI